MRSFKNHQLYQLTQKQFLETIREPEVLFWGMVFPVLISIGLGLAFMQTSESKFQVMVVENDYSELDSLLNIYAHTSESKGKSISTWKVTDETLGNTEFSFIRSDWESAIIS